MGDHLKGKSYVLLLGEAKSDTARIVGAAAAMAGQPVEHDEEVADDGAWMRSGQPPSAIVLDMRQGAAVRHAIDVRMALVRHNVPIVGVTDRLGDLAFEEGYAAGFDDVCPLDEQRLGRRLRRLAQIERAPFEKIEQTVVVADPDRVTRMLIGRVFHDAGYQVEFATEPDDVVSRALGDNVRVVIVSADIEEKMESVCLRASSSGSGAAFIVNTPPKEIPRMHARLADLSHCRLAVHDAFASSATLLFVTNELVNRPMVDFRESERLLYGATVRFRHAGRDDEEHGYLYNISGGGLYVRTLAPPERGDEVWLEFVPPRSDRRVHLEGGVAWARPFGPGFAATVPSGFGVKIEGGSPKDLARYQQSYRTFLAERAALLDTVLPVTREKPTLPAPTARSAL